MKKYFEKQLEKPRVITEDVFEAIQISPKYANLKIGDQICLYMNETEDDFEGEKTFTVELNPIKVEEIDTLENDYEFVRMSEDIPVLRKK
jgi:hypothetical protein